MWLRSAGVSLGSGCLWTASLTCVVDGRNHRDNWVTCLQHVAGKPRLLDIVAVYPKEQEKVSFDSQPFSSLCLCHICYSHWSSKLLGQAKSQCGRWSSGVRREILSTTCDRWWCLSLVLDAQDFTDREVGGKFIAKRGSIILKAMEE